MLNSAIGLTNPLGMRSIQIEEQIGNVQGKAISLAMLGQLVVVAQGDFVRAIDYLQQSLAILRQIQSADAQVVERILARVRGMAGG
jgi:hypothetical protein